MMWCFFNNTVKVRFGVLYKVIFINMHLVNLTTYYACMSYLNIQTFVFGYHHIKLKQAKQTNIVLYKLILIFIAFLIYSYTCT